MINKNEITELKKTFDDYKHIDKDGKEYWNAHELSKAMGYSEYSRFKPAIERAKDQMRNNGIDPDEHLDQSVEVLEHKNQHGATISQKVDGYKLDRRAAYTVAMNADPSKSEVAVAQEYFLQGTAKAEIIEKRLKDREYIESRDKLSIANKELSRTCLDHGVESDELGIVHNACDQGMYNMSTQEIKDKYGSPNKPKADYLGSIMCNAETFARDLTSLSIKDRDANGVKECSDVAYNINKAVRNQIIELTNKKPEKLITGEDVKKVKNKYNKYTAKQLKAMEQEF